jgi:FixJ family two-component response regulator
MSPTDTTVFLVDDDLSVLRGLSRLLRSAGWRTEVYQSPQDFIDRFDLHAPGCLVLDMSMPGLDGLELQRRLAEKGCPLPIVFLTGHGDIPTSVRAMKAGAIDFLTKPVRDEDLLRAIGQAVENDRIRRMERAETEAIAQRFAKLTPREREVLALVVSGKLNKQIAAELGTVEKTIKVHRARVMEKTGAHSLAELVQLTGRLRSL